MFTIDETNLAVAEAIRKQHTATMAQLPALSLLALAPPIEPLAR